MSRESPVRNEIILGRHNNEHRNNFYRNDRSEENREDSMSRSNKRNEPFKPKPRNLLALQQMPE